MTEHRPDTDMLLDDIARNHDIDPAAPHRLHPGMAQKAIRAAFEAGQEAARAEAGDTIAALEADVATLRAERDVFASTAADQALRLRDLGIDVLSDGIAMKAPATTPNGAWE